MPTILPKRELVQILARNANAETVRTFLGIDVQTPLMRRLEDFSKARLLQCIEACDAPVADTLRQREREYPLRSSPSAYLLVVDRSPDWGALQNRVREKFNTGRDGAVRFGEDRPVQRVYTAAEAHIRPGNPNLLELHIAYEIRVEYVEPDPQSPRHGELVTVLSLERAIVWLSPDPHKHALLICPDFVATGPIREYLKRHLDISSHQPNLTEDMLRKISQGARPRTATFVGRHGENGNPYDSATVMLADSNLGDTTAFRTLQTDRGREQTSGFFSNHPNLVLGGLGVARRYGRLWTPARQDRAALSRLAHGIIVRVEDELVRTLEQSTTDFVSYHRNVTVSIGGSRTASRVRDAFDLLLAKLLMCEQSEGHDAAITPAEVLQLLMAAVQLRLGGSFEFECEDCHLHQVAKCPVCGDTYECSADEDTLHAKCSCGTRAEFVEGFHCDCGAQSVVADLWNHLFLFPHRELAEALETTLGTLDHTLNGLFFVAGPRIKWVPRINLAGPASIHLDDLDLWRRVGRIVYRTADRANQVYARILNTTKEKCYINGVVTDTERCRQCKQTVPSRERIAEGQLCLPRLFGLPIETAFDGIHSGAEMADLKYTDSLTGVGPVRVGIHVKSADTEVKTLGRGNERIKGLYAQLCYSMYMVRLGQYPFDTLGISVPQDIKAVELESFRYIAERSGVRLLVMQRDDWLKVVDATYEVLAFNDAN